MSNFIADAILPKIGPPLGPLRRVRERYNWATSSDEEEGAVSMRSVPIAASSAPFSPALYSPRPRTSSSFRSRRLRRLSTAFSERSLLTDPSVASEPDSDDEVTLIRRADSDEEGKEGEAGGAEIEANGDDEGEDDGNEEEGEEDDDQDKSTTPDMIQFPEVPVADLVDTSGDAEPARLQTPTVATSPLPSSAMPQILDTQHPTTIPATPNKPQSESKKEPTTRGSRSSRRRQSRRPPTPPPPQPEHPDSPLSHLDASFNVLLSGGRDGRLAFRVHTPTSVSPLQWTGDERTSGFASANWHLGRLTPTAYTRALAAASAPSAGTRPPPSSPGIPLSDVNAIPLGASRYATFPGLPAHSAGGGAGARDPWPNWTAGAGVRQSLADHLTRKPRLRAHDPGDGQLIPPDALSPWISASADAQWAVWEAARLVGLGEPVVEIAVIALEGDQGATGEVLLDPLPTLSDHRRQCRGTGERGRMTHSEKEAVDLAITGARTSSELLFFGRVFARSIVANFAFTRIGLPFNLPSHFFHGHPSVDWVNRLVWTHYEDYTIAVSKIMAASKAEGIDGAQRGCPGQW